MTVVSSNKKQSPFGTRQSTNTSKGQPPKKAKSQTFHLPRPPSVVETHTRTTDTERQTDTYTQAQTDRKTFTQDTITDTNTDKHTQADRQNHR